MHLLIRSYISLPDCYIACIPFSLCIFLLVYLSPLSTCLSFRLSVVLDIGSKCPSISLACLKTPDYNSLLLLVSMYVSLSVWVCVPAWTYLSSPAVLVCLSVCQKDFLFASPSVWMSSSSPFFSLYTYGCLAYLSVAYIPLAYTRFLFFRLISRRTALSARTAVLLLENILSCKNYLKPNFNYMYFV